MAYVALLPFVVSDLCVFLGASGLVSDFMPLQVDRPSSSVSFLFLLSFGPKKLVIFPCVVQTWSLNSFSLIVSPTSMSGIKWLG